MFKRYSILLTIIVSILLLLIATIYYPGGSQVGKNSIGYDWKNNYISNLFDEKAINGSDNPSRLWAVFGMLFLSISFGFFYNEFSKKIPSKKVGSVIKYFGIGAMIFAFLAVTPYHNTMITIADTLALVSMFYITVFVFKTKLHFFKIVCAVCLIASYFCTYIYYTRNFIEILPIMQKIALAVSIIWMLALQYFTNIDDFQLKKLTE